MTKVLHTIKSTFVKTILFGVFLVGVPYIYAWTGPTASAPNGNTPAPLNVGGTEQKKLGVMDSTGLKADSSVVVDPGGYFNVGNAFLSSGGDYAHLAHNEWFNGSSWVSTGPGSLIQLTGQNVNFFAHSGGAHTLLGQIRSDGYVVGQTGLCIGGDCKSAWPTGGGINRSGSPLGAIPLYLCPQTWESYGGAWASHQCAGQISSVSYCSNFAMSAGAMTWGCTYIGTLQ